MRKKFFLLLLGAIISFAAMRYHEFLFERQSGRIFDIMEFELPGSAEQLTALILLWQDPPAKTFVLQQLFIDFFFMVFLFPAIACLCFWGAELVEKLYPQSNFSKSVLSRLLYFIGYAQFAALLFDISENIRLIQFIQHGAAADIFLFETLVRLKFILAILGILVGLSTVLISTFFLAKQKKRMHSLP